MSAACTLSLRRPPRRGASALCSLLLAALLALPSGARAADVLKAADAEILEQRMAVLVRSLRNMDTGSFLSCFSRVQASRYENTLTRPHRSDRITYARMAADIAAKSGWYEVFFDAGGDDVFRDHVLADGGKPWRRQGTRFTPPQPDAAGEVFVRWRREGSGWVVDTIAEPSG